MKTRDLFPPELEYHVTVFGRISHGSIVEVCAAQKTQHDSQRANRHTHIQTNAIVTDRVDVFEAGKDEVLQQLAADPPGSDHQHLGGGKGVSQLLSERTH